MISVILYGRNDSYGYNLHKRGAISFNCIAEVLDQPDDEIIFVDTNTPDDLPTFPEAIRDTLTPHARKLLRILRVRPASYEKFKNGTRMKVLEPLCRNVGIRRANPRNRWILNSNTDMVFVPTREGQSLSGTVLDLPDGLYELPRFEMPEMLWESLDRANPRQIMEQFRHWGRRLHLNEAVLGNRENVFDGPGDFQLAPRHQLFAIHGMNEQMVLGWHVDSNLCRRLFLLNGTTHSLLDRCYAYHCDHTRVNTMMHTAEGGTQNDTRRFVYDVTSPYLPEQAATWGMPQEPVEEIRLSEEGSHRYCDVLERLLPGMSEPMLHSALFAESFNHGLLYDSRHVLPYLTDHLCQLPPDADIAYFGANLELLKLVADFRRGFGHTGRLLYDPACVQSGGGRDVATLPETCVAQEAQALCDRAFAFCLDLWMGNFPATKNAFGFSVPSPSSEAARFGAVMMRRLRDLARREKALYDINPARTRKFLFIGTQNTWFEGAATQFVNSILTPYSSYVRHGMIRKDAFQQPFIPVPGHTMLLGENLEPKQLIERALGRSVREFEFVNAWIHGCALERGLTDLTSESARNALLENKTGLAVLQTMLEMAEVDGRWELAAAIQNTLESLARERACSAGGFKPLSGNSQAPRPTPDKTPAHLNITDTPPMPNGTGSVAPQAIQAGRGSTPCIGVDIRPLCDPATAESLAGRHALTHLEHVARCRPEWNFQLLHNGSTPPATASKLLTLPNVKVAQELQPEALDLLHLPAPLHSRPGEVLSLWGVPGSGCTAMLHDLDYLRLNREQIKVSDHFEVVKRLRRLLDSGCRWLTVSDFTRLEFAKATGTDLEAITAIQSGLFSAEPEDRDSAAEVRRVRQNYGLKHRFLLHVGSIEKGHNFESVITAFGKLRARDLDLVVIGERTHALQNVANFVRDRRVPGILFPGAAPEADLRVLYREAAALVWLSSLCDFAFPVLEAMNQGCPVIAAQAACFPELCGDAALLFDPKDTPGISRALERLLHSPAFHSEWAGKARGRARQFAWEGTAQKTISVWEELLKRDTREAIVLASPLTNAPEDGITPKPDASSVSAPQTPEHLEVGGQPSSAAFEPAPVAKIETGPRVLAARSLSIVSPSQNAKPAKPQPLVSAIVSAYNSTRFLVGCLEDLERQTIADRLEIIVVDSASPQDERSIVEEFQRRYSNIIYLRSPERETVYGAWNRGIKASRGKYITNANTDDRHRRDALEILARRLEENPDVSLVYGDCLVTRTENETFENAHVVSRFEWLDFNAADLLLKGCFVGPQPMWRREVHDEHGYFEPDFISAGDYEFWLRLARTRKFLHVREMLGLYLESPTSVEHRNREHGIREVHEARRRHGPAIVPGFVAVPPENCGLQKTSPDPRSDKADQRGTSKHNSVCLPPQPQPSLKLPPCALAGHLAAARELLRAGKRPAAWAATLSALEARPFHPEAFLLLAEIARSAGDAALARRCAERARELAPQWQPARQFLKGKPRGIAKASGFKLPEALLGQSPPRLSLCLIAKNEEAFIAQCLASVRGLTAQIVLVDTGSTDRTVEIARELGAEVYTFAWCDDFSAARNAALEHVRGDWVLVLDADEELPPESHDALRSLMSAKEVMAWRLPILDVGREDEGGSYVPRLFRNAPGLFYVGRVHEQVFTSIEVRRREWGLENRLGNASLRHHGYQPELVRDRRKSERNLRLLERALEELPGEPFLLMNYGLELVNSGQPEKALANYRRAFEAMSVQDRVNVVPETRETLLLQYCGQLLRGGLFEEAVRVLQSPLAVEAGLSASLHFILGLAQLELKQPLEAAQQMRHCLEKRGQPALAPIHKEIRTAAPRHCLALALAQMEQFEAAAEEFRLALAESPKSRPVRLDYARFQASRGQMVQAIQLLYELAAEKPDDLPVWVQGGQLALSRPEFLQVARNWTAEARRRAPHDAAILRQRAEALLLSGQADAAFPLWRELQPSGDPAAQAALIMCEIVSGKPPSIPRPESESAISREFLKWYRRLVAWKAQALLHQVNERIEALREPLPAAARTLAAAFTQARAREAVPV